jgi:hypothetical protein
LAPSDEWPPLTLALSPGGGLDTRSLSAERARLARRRGGGHWKHQGKPRSSVKWFGLGSVSLGATATHELVCSPRLLGYTAGYVKMGEVNDPPDRLRNQ